MEGQTISQTRIPHWRDGLKAAADFWHVGSGLGTYRYVYRPYQDRPSDVWYIHAENQYLEALVEGGCVGLGLVLVMIGLVGAGAWQLLKHEPNPEGVAFGVVATFALASQAIHALFDFGLYIPANMVLFAVLCGAVSGRAAHLAKWRLAPRLLALPRFRLVSAVLATSVFAAVLWGCLETSSAAEVETSLKSSGFVRSPDAVSRERLLDAIRQVEAAAARREDDAEAQLRLAVLWLRLYRAGADDRHLEEAGAGPAGPSPREAPSTLELHGRAHDLVRKSRRSELEQLRNDPVVRPHLTSALEHLVLARRACPLLPEVHVSLAELCFLVTDPAEDRIHIGRSLRLSPPDADLLRHCGLLELQAGRDYLACERLRESLALSLDHLDDILYVASQELGLLRTIEDVLPDSPALLIELAQQRYRAEGQVHVRFLLAERARSLVDKKDLPEAERHYVRGAAHALTSRYPEAISEVSRAVELRPRYAPWRYELALLLEEQGRIGEAHEQAMLCARMEPDNAEYRELLEGINHTRIMAGTTLE
jgi:tetratricopeptide (TPR) repeat protein